MDDEAEDDDDQKNQSVLCLENEESRLERIKRFLLILVIYFLLLSNFHFNYNIHLVPSNWSQWTSRLSFPITSNTANRDG